MLESIIITGLLSAFAMLLMSKYNYFEKVRVKLSIEPCLICHCFWICFVVSCVICILQAISAPEAILYAACATPITYFIAVR